MRKHEIDLHNMTEDEITSAIYEGKGVNELVSLDSVFSKNQICELPSHPAWHKFSGHFKAWVYNAIECIILEDEAALA